MFSDLKYAFRQFAKNPGFTASVTLILAIGIGASTIAFGVVNTTVLHPLSYPQLDRLMVVHGNWLRGQYLGRISPADYVDIGRQSAAFTSLAADTSLGHNYIIGKEPVRLYTEHVTTNLFSTLGVRPILGRDFRPEEEIAGRGNVVILSYNLWQEDFGGRPDAIGQTMLMEDQVTTVIGVMPQNFQAYASAIYGAAIYTPITGWPALRQNRFWRNFQVIGRLKPGTTVTQARSEMNVIASRLARQYPDTDQDWGLSVVPLLDDTVDFARPLLYTLLGAVGLLLLIACVNIANLLLARAASRQKEIVIRSALGAGRGRIVRQLLCECLLLALAGGAGGVLLAYWGIGLVGGFLPANLPAGAGLAVDGPTLAFTGAVVVLTGLGFGLVPALQSARVDLNRVLKDGGRGSSDGGRGLRLRRLLVVSEISLALILLVGAGLLVRSSVAYESLDRGFQPSGLYVSPIALDQSKYSDPQNRINFVDRVVENLSHVHGIRSAAFALGSLEGGVFREFYIAGRPEAPAGSRPGALTQSVSPGYFKTMGVPFRRGRLFNARDNAAAPSVVLVNQALVRRFFPDRDPIGQRVQILLNPKDPLATEKTPGWSEIVGVVGNVRFESDDPTGPPGPRIYLALSQVPDRNVALGVRTDPGVPLDLRAVSAALHAVESEVPLTSMFGFGPPDRGTPAIRRVSMIFSALFSGVALLLAAIGIYGVMAFNVSQRTGEIGIRMALGAQRGDVLRLIMTAGARLICLGILVGLAGALAAGRLIGSLLFNVQPYDLLTFGGITLIVALVGFIACLLPSLRATKVDPMTALRSE